MKNFKIIGISIETTNQNNQASEDLNKLWSQFYSEQVLSKIPNKENEAVYAIYTDYESDYTVKYTAIIGQQVSTLETIPEGLIGREIINDQLLKYTVIGEMPGAVIHTWKEIWENDKTLSRTYKADFEVYGQESQNGADSNWIFIGVA